jgi:hypothetical protein
MVFLRFCVWIWWWCLCGFGCAHWCFFVLFATRVVLFRGTTFLIVERLVQINDEVVRAGCQYLSPKRCDFALYAAAFVMLVLV